MGLTGAGAWGQVERAGSSETLSIIDATAPVGEGVILAG